MLMATSIASEAADPSEALAYGIVCSDVGDAAVAIYDAPILVASTCLNVMSGDFRHR